MLLMMFSSIYCCVHLQLPLACHPAQSGCLVKVMTIIHAKDGQMAK
jgi:hypothetical protein